MFYCLFIVYLIEEKYMQKMRKNGLNLLLSLALLLIIAGCGNTTSTNSAAPTSLRIGYIADMHGGAIISVANHENYWSQYGVQPEAQSFLSGPPEITAIAAGKLDIAYIGPGAEWLAASGKATIITVDSLNVGDFLLAQPGSGINNLADLKGKTVGVPLGTSGEMILRLALQRVGLTEKDVQLRPLDPASVVTAFISGKIDAAAIWSPLTTQIEQRVPGTKVLIDDSAFFPTYSFPQMWVASPSLVKNHPDEIEKFLKVFAQANDYRDSHLSQVVQWTATLAQAPAAGLQAQTTTTQWLTSSQIAQDNQNGTTYHWFNGLNNVFVQMKRLSTPGNPQDFVNIDLFDKVVQQH
jgi:NitT/TauT family transport system substrate-binding protein